MDTAREIPTAEALPVDHVINKEEEAILWRSVEGIPETYREPGEHDTFKIPALNSRGTPLGIDIRKVVETGFTPVINTGIACRRPGVGQIGAGITAVPMECFEKALEAFAATRSKIVSVA